MKQLREVPLPEALGAGRGDLVSLVGGGGKTTLMYALTVALRAAGVHAAAATTTKIAPPTPDDPCRLLLAAEYDALRDRLAAAAGPVVLGRRMVRGGTKVGGVPAGWCDRLLADGELECLVVEADGAARKPVKAPAEGEPVVPETTGVFVAVVGLSCLGSPLDEAHVFRTERVAEVTGVAPGTPLSPEAVTRLLASSRGLAKGCPAGARAVALLNQADSERERRDAREIAAALLAAGGRYERVLIGALGRESTVREVCLP